MRRLSGVTASDDLPTPPPVSPDGKFWWDGTEWRPMGGSAGLPPVRSNGAANLDRAVVDYVAMGWRVESKTDSQAVLVRGGNTNHVLHLLLSCVTCFAWAIIWFLVAISNQKKTVVLSINSEGLVRVS